MSDGISFGCSSDPAMRMYRLDFTHGTVKEIDGSTPPKGVRMSESRKEFLARVDETNTVYEQALFIAVCMLETIAEGAGNPERMAKLCLASIDDRLMER